jgi:nicotinamide-nucleotide amidase
MWPPPLGMFVDDPLLSDDARGLVADLTIRKQTVATAESLTAGLLAATLAGVPGASEVLRGGLITYTEQTKIALAGVAQQILDEVGPVAGPTARALAVGARQRCDTTWGVGLTGVAGPEPHGGHAVGTVFIGLAGPGESGAIEVVELQFTGTRWDIRIAAVRESISRLRALVAVA